MEPLSVCSLSLHRNICQNCKCPRELHDLYHEGFVNVRDRLGWKRQDDPTQHVSKEMTLQQGYTWVPPGLASDKVGIKGYTCVPQELTTDKV